MDADKKKQLVKKGFRIGSADEFINETFGADEEANTELRECPFCGYSYGMFSENKDGTHTVFCGHCIASTRDCSSKNEAVDAWNLRTA